MARLSVSANFRCRLAWWIPLAKVLTNGALFYALQENWPDMTPDWAVAWLVSGAVLGLAGSATAAVLGHTGKEMLTSNNAVFRFDQWMQTSTTTAHWVVVTVLASALVVVLAAECLSADDGRYLLAGAAAAVATITLGEFAFPVRQKWWRVEEMPAFKWSTIATGLTRGQAKALEARFLARQKRSANRSGEGTGDGHGGLEFADLDLATIVKVSRSRRMYGIFAIGAASLASAWYVFHPG